MDRALTPSTLRDRALARGVAALLLLGAHHAAVECRPAFALWSVGRPLPWAPSAALLALHALALAMLALRWPRACAALAAATLAALYAAVPATYHNNHYLLFVALCLVALAPADAAGPVDLARAVRWQLALVYFTSVVVKLAHPWWQGSGAVVRWLATTRAPESNPHALTTRAFARLLSAPMPSRLAELAVTALEVAIPLALASRRTRRAAVVTGVLLHVAMQEWLFPQLFTFLMLLGYFAWSPAGDRAWTLHAPPGAARAVAALDPLGRVEVRPAQAWCLVDPTGRAHPGPWAAVRFTALTPLTVVAWAAVALLFPEHRSVGPVPRDALENALVAAYLTALVAGTLLSRDPKLPGRKSSHPK